MPAACPADEASHWPQSGALQLRRALVPHLGKKEPTSTNVQHWEQIPWGEMPIVGPRQSIPIFPTLSVPRLNCGWGILWLSVYMITSVLLHTNHKGKHTPKGEKKAYLRSRNLNWSPGSLEKWTKNSAEMAYSEVWGSSQNYITWELPLNLQVPIYYNKTRMCIGLRVRELFKH